MSKDLEKFEEKNRETKREITWDREIDSLLHLMTQELNVGPSELLAEALIQYLHRHQKALDRTHREYLWIFWCDDLPGVNLNFGEITKQLEDRKPEPELEEGEILESKERSREEAREKRLNDYLL